MDCAFLIIIIGLWILLLKVPVIADVFQLIVIAHVRRLSFSIVIVSFNCMLILLFNSDDDSIAKTAITLNDVRMNMSAELNWLQLTNIKYTLLFDDSISSIKCAENGLTIDWKVCTNQPTSLINFRLRNSHQFDALKLHRPGAGFTILLRIVIVEFIPVVIITSFPKISGRNKTTDVYQIVWQTCWMHFMLIYKPHRCVGVGCRGRIYIERLLEVAGSDR